MIAKITVSRSKASIVVVAAAGLAVSVLAIEPPKVVDRLHPAAIASTLNFPTASVTPGQKSLLAAAIVGTSNVRAPAVAVSPASALLAPLIDSTASVGRPTVLPGSVAVLAPYIPGSGVVRQPAMLQTASGATVSPALVQPVAAIHAPSVNKGAVQVMPALVQQSAAIFAPAVDKGAVQVSPASIIRTSTAPSPTVASGAVGVAPSAVPSNAVVASPIVNVGSASVRPALLSGTSAFYAALFTQVSAAYDPDAQAAFAAMTVQPSANRKTLYNNLIVGLKADGIWAKLDWLAILAAETAQAGRLNLRNPSKAWAAINSPTFTADRGYQGDGTSSHLDMGEPFGFSGALFTRNDAHLMAAANDGGLATSRSPHIGNTGAARAQINILGVAGNNTYAINASVAVAYAGSGVANGIRIVTRSTSTDSIAYTNGAVVSSVSSTSGGVSSTNGTLLRTASAYSDDRVCAAGSGSNLTAADVTAYYTRLNTFLSAIGAL